MSLVDNDDWVSRNAMHLWLNCGHTLEAWTLDLSATADHPDREECRLVAETLRFPCAFAFSRLCDDRQVER